MGVPAARPPRLFRTLLLLLSVQAALVVRGDCPTAAVLTASPGVIMSDTDGAGPDTFDVGTPAPCTWQIACPTDRFVALTRVDGYTGQLPSPESDKISNAVVVDRVFFSLNITAQADAVEWPLVLRRSNATVRFAPKEALANRRGFTLHYDCVPSAPYFVAASASGSNGGSGAYYTVPWYGLPSPRYELRLSNDTALSDGDGAGRGMHTYTYHNGLTWDVRCIDEDPTTRTTGQAASPTLGADTMLEVLLHLEVRADTASPIEMVRATTYRSDDLDREFAMPLTYTVGSAEALVPLGVSHFAVTIRPRGIATRPLHDGVALRYRCRLRNTTLEPLPDRRCDTDGSRPLAPPPRAPGPSRAISTAPCAASEVFILDGLVGHTGEPTEAWHDKNTNALYVNDVVFVLNLTALAARLAATPAAVWPLMLRTGNVTVVGARAVDQPHRDGWDLRWRCAPASPPHGGHTPYVGVPTHGAFRRLNDTIMSDPDGAGTAAPTVHRPGGATFNVTCPVPGMHVHVDELSAFLADWRTELHDSFALLSTDAAGFGIYYDTNAPQDPTTQQRRVHFSDMRLPLGNFAIRWRTGGDNPFGPLSFGMTLRYRCVAPALSFLQQPQHACGTNANPKVLTDGHGTLISDLDGIRDGGVPMSAWMSCAWRVQCGEDELVAVTRMAGYMGDLEFHYSSKMQSYVQFDGIVLAHNLSEQAERAVWPVVFRRSNVTVSFRRYHWHPHATGWEIDYRCVPRAAVAKPAAQPSLELDAWRDPALALPFVTFRFYEDPQSLLTLPDATVFSDGDGVADGMVTYGHARAYGWRIQCPDSAAHVVVNISSSVSTWIEVPRTSYAFRSPGWDTLQELIPRVGDALLRGRSASVGIRLLYHDRVTSNGIAFRYKCVDAATSTADVAIPIALPPRWVLPPFAPKPCSARVWCNDGGEAVSTSDGGCACRCAVNWTGTHCDRCASGFAWWTTPPCQALEDNTADDAIAATATRTTTDSIAVERRAATSTPVSDATDPTTPTTAAATTTAAPTSLATTRPPLGQSRTVVREPGASHVAASPTRVIDLRTATMSASAGTFIAAAAEDLSPAGRAAAAAVYVVAPSAAAVAVISGGSAAAGDLQVLGVMPYVPCASDGTRAATDGGRRTIAPFTIGASELAGLFALLAIFATGATCHFALVAGVSLATRTPFATVAVLRRWPSVTVWLWMLCLQGLALEALLLVHAPDRSLATRALCATVIAATLVAVPSLRWFRTRYPAVAGVSADAADPNSAPQQPTPAPSDDLHFLPYGAGIEALPAALRPVMPRGRWYPPRMTRRYGSVFNSFAPSRTWFVYALLLRPPAIALVASLRATSATSCRTQFLALGAVQFAFAALQLWLRPHRASVRSVAGGVNGVVTACVVALPGLGAVALPLLPFAVLAANATSVAATAVNISVMVVERTRMKKAEGGASGTQPPRDASSSSVGASAGASAAPLLQIPPQSSPDGASNPLDCPRRV